MKFIEIPIMEAMEFISKGRDIDGLYYMRYVNSDLLCYNKYEISAKDIHKLKWFLLMEEEAE